MANGIWFDTFGNIHMSPGSANFRIVNSRNQDIVKR